MGINKLKTLTYLEERARLPTDPFNNWGESNFLCRPSRCLIKGTSEKCPIMKRGHPCLAYRDGQDTSNPPDIVKQNEKLKEEIKKLKEENERLMKEIEELQEDNECLLNDITYLEIDLQTISND